MKSLRVLIVEDDIMIGKLLAETLSGLGHEVCAIEATEAGAVAAAYQYKPDLMIIDARLGNGSGVAAIDAISRTRTVPHFFISGVKFSPSLGGAMVLQKPFSEAELARAIRGTVMPT